MEETQEIQISEMQIQAKMLEKLVHDSVQKRAWQKASAHVAGEGLQAGAEAGGRGQAGRQVRLQLFAPIRRRRPSRKL